MTQRHKPKTLRALALIALLMAGLWGLLFYNWPTWALLALTIVLGVASSFALGLWFVEKIQEKIADDDEIARAAIQREFDDASRG